MVVPASSTFITSSSLLIRRSISCVSLASDRFRRADESVCDRAQIISARLLMLFEAGKNSAIPFSLDRWAIDI